jgi:hypothetical protein
MKKILGFLLGLLLIVLTIGLIWGAAAIYDTGNKLTVDTFFFQPANLSDRRPGTPKSVSDVGEDEIRRMLIEKFISEYFYVIPVQQDLEMRLAGKTALVQMALPEVFAAWQIGEATKIQDLIDAKAMRVAHVVNIIPRPGIADYWTIEYELRTWTHPNDLSVLPVVERGRMYMSLRYEPGFRPSIQVGPYLEQGGDPAVLFKFMVTDVQR